MTPGPSRPAFPRPLLAYLERSFPGLSHRRLAGLRWFFLDAVTSQASSSFYEDFFVLFALATGVTAGRIGLLVSAGGLASVLAFLPGAFLAARLRVRKPMIMLTSGGVARLAILGLVFLPSMTTGGVAVLAGIAILRFTTALMGSVANPAGTTLAADLVPPEIRGRYFALRNAAISVVGAGASVIAGWTVRLLNAGSSDGLRGYRGAFVIAFVGGMIATACFSRIPEPPVRRIPRLTRRIGDIAALVRRNPGFAWLALSSALWGLAVNTAGPYFNVYLVTELGGNAAVVGVAAGIFALTGLAGLLVFGRMADRRGSRPVLILTGLVIPLLPALWALLRAPWHLYLLNIPSGFFWAGYTLASYNLLLEMSPPQDREAGVAVYQTLVAVSAIGGPLLGAWLAGLLGYVPMFAVTGVGRLAATLLFIALARPKA